MPRYSPPRYTRVPLLTVVNVVYVNFPTNNFKHHTKRTKCVLYTCKNKIKFKIKVTKKHTDSELFPRTPLGLYPDQRVRKRQKVSREATQTRRECSYVINAVSL